MIKLYGLRMSNYYSLTKALLIEKNVEFEEVKAPPAQDDEYLARSPMGKMPSIELDGRFLSESLAIFHYLEHKHPEPSLLPDDPLEAAKVMELLLHVKLDVELVARRCLPEVLFNKPSSDETKKEVRRDLGRGMNAVSRLLVADPYAAGSEFTIADLYIFYSFGAASMIAQRTLELDITEDHPELVDLLGRLRERPSIAQVTEEATS